MADRSLEALGLARVPALHPLTYPGAVPAEPVLLHRRNLFRLVPAPHGRLGRWRVGDVPPDNGTQPSLDSLLARIGRPTTEKRFPVIAVGSNGSPAQICHKLSQSRLSDAVPMVPVTVRGIGVGVSAHVSRAGYVSASPYADPGGAATLIVTWLDDAQLAAVDETERGYRRALLPGSEFPMTMPTGERLGGSYLYVNRVGVLRDGSGRPRRSKPQPELLTDLLSSAPKLRALLGNDPQTFVARAGLDQKLREQAGRIFTELGWVLPQPAFEPYITDRPAARAYQDLEP